MEDLGGITGEEVPRGLLGALDAYTRPTRNFLWKYRGRVALGAAAVVAVGAYVVLRARPPLTALSVADVEESEDEDDWTGMRRRHRSAMPLSAPGSKTLERSRMLLRVRKQYDTAAMQFLRTLKARIDECVDVKHTILQIRALRAGPANGLEDTAEAEARLWEDIKVSSFTYLFVTAYTEIATCLALRIQLHILARSAKVLSADAGAASAAAAAAEMASSSSSSMDAAAGRGGRIRPLPPRPPAGPLLDPLTPTPDLALLDNDMFKVLIPGTYKQLFGAGVLTLTDAVRRRVEADLHKWTVKKLMDYSELAQMITGLRRGFEQDLRALVSMILLRECLVRLSSASSLFLPLTPPPPPVILSRTRHTRSARSLHIPRADAISAGRRGRTEPPVADLGRPRLAQVRDRLLRGLRLGLPPRARGAAPQRLLARELVGQQLAAPHEPAAGQRASANQGHRRAHAARQARPHAAGGQGHHRGHCAGHALCAAV